MRNWGFYMILLFLCLGCQKQQNSFTVKGHINGYTGSQLYVREMVPDNKEWMNDTIEVKDGVFVYTGRVDCPRMVYLVPQDFRCRYELFLDNSDIRMEVENGKPQTMKVSGSRTHNEYRAMIDVVSDILAQRKAYQYRSSQANKLKQPYTDSTEFWTSRLLKILLDRPNYATSEVLPYFASEWIPREDLDSLEKYLKGLDKMLETNCYVRYCSHALLQGKAVKPGAMAYDFTLQDTTGKTYRLSDYRGKYVLIEFSASWCGWCKKEILYLKKVYELAKGKNLVMFTINLDKERELWVNDVAKENLPWPMISNLQAFEGELTRRYNVSGIPEIYLIDPEGKIVTNQLRGEKMIEYIKKLLL